MKYRGPLIGLSLFMVVAITLTWLVYVTLRRDVAGEKVPYSAMFTDVFGLREGDDVRMAGVRVGRVDKIERTDDNRARIEISVEGTVMRTEFQKPRERPSQLRPVQAVAQALAQGSNVTSTGGEKMLPRRISGMPFSDVTTIT